MQLAERLAGAAARMKVLYVSGYAEQSIAAPRGGTEPGVEFLSKPFTAPPG